MRTRLVVVIVAVLAVLLLFFLFFIRPRQNELSQVRDQVEAEEADTTRLQAELQRLQDLQANAPQLQEALDEIREFVPQKNNVPNFIFQVQDAANRSGVGFLQITPELPKPPPEVAQVAEIRVTLQAKGGYFAVQDFMRRLYTLDRALRIDNLTMTREEAEAATRINLQMAARIFFELPAGAATGTTTNTGTTTAPVATPPPSPSPTG